MSRKKTFGYLLLCMWIGACIGIVIEKRLHMVGAIILFAIAGAVVGAFLEARVLSRDDSDIENGNGDWSLYEGLRWRSGDQNHRRKHQLVRRLDHIDVEPVRVSYYGLKHITLVQFLSIQITVVVVALVLVCVTNSIVFAKSGFCWEMLEIAEESPWSLDVLIYTPVLILSALGGVGIETVVFIRLFRNKAVKLQRPIFKPPTIS